MRPTQALCNAGVAGVLCAAAADWLRSGDAPYLLLALQCAAFLLTTLAVLLQTKRDGKNAALACLIALGARGVLTTASGGASAAGIAGVGVYVGVLAAFLGLFAAIRPYLPAVDWADYFYCGERGEGAHGVHRWWIYGLLTLLSLFLNALGLYSTPDLWRLGIESGVALLAFGLSVVTVVLMIDHQKQQLAMATEQQYRTEMQSFLNVIRSQRHDYNFHVTTIAGLIREGKIKECQDYINALEQDSVRMNTILPMSDPAIAATIFHFQTQAASKGIELRIDIQNDLAQIATNVYETNKIISNLLQNAIDEVSGHRDKTYGIQLTILKRSEYCIIRVSNEVESRQITASELGQFYRQGYTTKKGHEGVGLSGIRVLAERYRGTIYTQVDGKVLHFVAKIPINVAKSPEG
jgi:signal transduction histidine kinase